jgi:hypothetical protein
MKLAAFLSVLAAFAASAHAATINIAFHNGGTTVNAMTSRPGGTLVNTTAETWNNPANNAGVGLVFTNFALNDSAGAATGASLAAAAGASAFNNNGWGTQSQDHVMMEGWYGLFGTESITISNLPTAFTSGGYTVTIYGDSASVRTMNYTIGGTTQTISDTGIFTGTFTTENSTTFNALGSAAFTITGNGAGTTRSAINGIVIQSIPEPTAPALGLAAGFLLLRRRRI